MKTVNSYHLFYYFHSVQLPTLFDDVISRLGGHVEYSIGTKTLGVIDLKNHH